VDGGGLGEYNQCLERKLRESHREGGKEGKGSKENVVFLPKKVIEAGGKAKEGIRKRLHY